MLLRLFRALMPKEDRYVAAFSRHSEVAVEAAGAFREMLQASSNHDGHFERVRALEKAADVIARETVQALHRTNIGPFDREDIHALIAAQDDIIDLMKKAAGCIGLYKVAITPQMLGMTDCIVEATAQLREV